MIKDFCLISLLLLYLSLIFRNSRLKNEIKKQKRYFIETLGHDFRVAVIAQIRGIDVLKKSLKFRSEKNCIVDCIDDSCKYTLDMINMMMKIYKLENGDLPIKYESIDSSELISQVMDNYQSIASEKGINLIFHIEGENINSDKEHLLKIIQLLVHSGIQYSKKESDINITIKNLPDKILLNISYKGIPLSEEEQNRMFSKNPNFSTVGHGISMYLCKKIVDLHNGKINFKSGVYNTNNFSVSLPKKASRLSLRNLILS